MADAIHVFDRRAVRRHRERAAADFARHDFLHREVAARLADRLDDINRGFAHVLDLGSRDTVLFDAIADRSSIERIVRLEPSAALALGPGLAVAGEEELLPFAEESFDAVLSCLALHWVNDLPGALVQANRALRPDGLFLAAMLGGDTLHELRECLLAGEAEVEGGASPRVSPFVELGDAAGLLQRAGFALPVADYDRITVTYPDALALMRELRGMGESNAAVERRRGFTRRETLMRAAALYAERFSEADGRVAASFQVLYLTGWAPAPGQPRPLRPGSARARLADALGVRERTAGDKARPR